MHRRHFLHSLLAASVLTQAGCFTAALSDGHRMGGKHSGPATSGRRIHNMGRFQLYADASLSQLIVVGENQHWILNTGAARDTLKQVLPSSIKSPAAWLFSNASLAMPDNMAQGDAPKVALRFFSVYRPHALSPAKQQTLQALGYETDTNAATPCPLPSCALPPQAKSASMANPYSHWPHAHYSILISAKPLHHRPHKSLQAAWSDTKRPVNTSAHQNQ